MTVLTHHLRVAAYVVGQEIERRRRYGHPIPAAMREALDAINSALSVDGRAAVPVLSRLKTTEQLAAEWGCRPRTVRRKAAAAGAKKIGRQWLFEDQEDA